MYTHTHLTHACANEVCQCSNLTYTCTNEICQHANLTCTHANKICQDTNLAYTHANEACQHKSDKVHLFYWTWSLMCTDQSWKPRTTITTHTLYCGDNSGNYGYNSSPLSSYNDSSCISLSWTGLWTRVESSLNYIHKSTLPCQFHPAVILHVCRAMGAPAGSEWVFTILHPALDECVLEELINPTCKGFS